MDTEANAAKRQAVLQIASMAFIGARSACTAEAINQMALSWKSTNGNINIHDLNITQTASATADCTSSQTIEQHHIDTAAAFKAMMASTFPDDAHTIDDITTSLTSTNLQTCYSSAINSLTEDIEHVGDINVTGSLKQTAEANTSKCVNTYVSPAVQGDKLISLNNTTPLGAAIACAKQRDFNRNLLYASSFFVALVVIWWVVK